MMIRVPMSDWFDKVEWKRKSLHAACRIASIKQYAPCGVVADHDPMSIMSTMRPGGCAGI